MKVLITGGQGDIARAIAVKLSGQFEIFAPGRHKLNVVDFREVKNYIESIKPDILINCAGAIEPENVSGSDEAKWVRQIDVNLVGAYYCAKCALENGAQTIINIGSSAGSKGKAGWSAYCASKAGLISFTQSLAAEGINAYCISPGRTATKMRKRLFPDEDPMTLALPKDIAEVVFEAITGRYEKGENVCLSKK